MSEYNTCLVCHALYRGNTTCAQCGTPFAFSRTFADMHAWEIWYKAVEAKANEWIQLQKLSNFSGSIALARSSIIVLNLDAKQAFVLSQLGKKTVIENVVQVSQSDTHSLFVFADGTVRATGSNERQACNTAGLIDIRYAKASVHASYYVKRNGEVICRGTSPFKNIIESITGEIKQIACGKNHIAWLLDDGQVFVSAIPFKTNQSLCENSRIIEERKECLARIYAAPTSWHHITAIDAAEDYVMAMDYEGNVHIIGNVGETLEKPNWDSAAIAITASRDYAIALAKNGHVMTYGKSRTILPDYSIINGLQGWKNVKSIAANGNFVAALDKDGKLLLAGSKAFQSQLTENKAFQLYFSDCRK